MHLLVKIAYQNVLHKGKLLCRSAHQAELHPRMGAAEEICTKKLRHFHEDLLFKKPNRCRNQLKSKERDKNQEKPKLLDSLIPTCF